MSMITNLSRGRDAALDAHDGGRGAAEIVETIDRVDPDAAKPPELGMALLELVRRIVKPGNSRMTAQRFIGLVMHVCPDVLGLSQSAAAKGLGVTRASLSKVSIQLSEDLGLGHSRWRKSESSRIAYRSAQIRARLYGRHVSQIQRKKKHTAKSGS
jgi:hypothetical protein